jgi:hypothetical protein
MLIHAPALDEITHGGSWTNYDDYGRVYYGLIKPGIQNPLSVQWCQDDRGASEPPSWWERVELGVDAGRESTIEAVVPIDTGDEQSILRTLAYADFRTDETKLTAPAGTPDEDLWQYGFDWEKTYEATKHLLAGEQVYGDTEGGQMPWSEDVWCWDLYRWLRLVVSCDSDSDWSLSITLSYSPSPLIIDPFYTDAEDRQDGYSVSWTTSSVTYTVTVPANASSVDVDIDLVTAGAPELYRVRSILIEGIPSVATGASEFRLHDLHLIPPSADTRLECQYPRPMRYGGTARSSCADGSSLGTAKHPEEYNSRWLFGGHRPLNIPCDGGRSLDIAPQYGLKMTARRIGDPDCGPLKDFLKGFGETYNELLGTWGQEGIYGATHVASTDAAAADFFDEDDAQLGPNYVSDCPELMWWPIPDGDFLTTSRGADGPGDLPVCLVVGAARLAEGMCWANAGNAIEIGAKKFFYGSRISLYLTSSGSTYTRGGSGETMTLYEEASNGVRRLVDTENTDADSRVRFTSGVNEFRHNESGPYIGTNPDYADRLDYLSDVLAPDETTDDLSFGIRHYQPIPSFLGVEAVLAGGDTDILETPLGWVFVAYTAGSGITVHFYDPTTLAYQVIATVSGANNPAWLQTGDGEIWLTYYHISSDTVKMVKGVDGRVLRMPPSSSEDPLVEAISLISGYTKHSIAAELDMGVVHFIGYSGGQQKYVRLLMDTNEYTFTTELTTSIGSATEARGSIEVLGDGTLLAAYYDNTGDPKKAVSSNYGETWTLV